MGWVFFKMVPTKISNSCLLISILRKCYGKNIYYASKTIVLPDLCYYCGGRSASPLCNNAKIKQLKKEFTKVRPTCTNYVADGKEPAKSKNEAKHYFLAFYVL